MKKFFFLTLFLFFVSWLSAQDNILHHTDKGFFVTHTVAPKENFYSLGRSFVIPPKDIAAFNNLDMEKGLNIGQTVNIPLTAANFTQETQKGQPVYYVVGEKEGLYRVSVKNGKVLMANLRKWNNLQTDAIATGQRLVVGFITAQDAATVTTKTTVPEKKEPLKVAEEKKDVVIKDEKPAEKLEEVAPKKLEKKEVVTEKRPDEPRIVNTSSNDVNGGYFKSSFEQQVKQQPVKKDEAATAGIFKTASGWQDAKYYALIDGVEPGIIIRVTNPTNNKAVYAKVLDKMTGIRQNQGYTMRISNAAATALDISDTEKFVVRVNY